MGSKQSSQLSASRKQSLTKSITSELDFIFKRSIFWRPGYIAQSAWLEHIPFAFWLIESLQPRKIVELGTHYGSSYFSFCQAVTKLELQTQCYAVDTWDGDVHAGQYGEEVYRQVSEHNHQHYSDFSTLVRSTFDQALEHFPQGSIDLLHIDGLHTLEAVRHDFESWLPKLSDRAVVIMHDTNVRERGFGVFQLMEELKQHYPCFEFAHGHGLGVIGVGNQQSAEMLNLYNLSASTTATRQTQEIFSRLGKACAYSWENGELKRQITVTQDKQQAENLQVLEQQALERGHLAERITAQYHTLNELEEKLKAQADKDTEIALKQKQLIELATELSELKDNFTQAQTALSQAEQQRVQNEEKQSNLTTLLAEHQEKLMHAVAQRDTAEHEKYLLLEQQSAAQQQQTALQQQLHEQALQLHEETQRAAQLTLAMSKSNTVMTEYSQQVGTLQQKIDEQSSLLAVAQQAQDKLTEDLLTKTEEVSQWHQQAQLFSKKHNELQQHCEEISATLETNQDQLQQYTSAQHLWQTCEMELRNGLESKTLEITNLAHALSQSNQEAATCKNELEQTREALSALQKKYQAEQDESEQQLVQLNQSINERFCEIATLTQQLEKREETAVIEQKVLHEEYQQQLAQLNQSINERFCEIATLTQQLEKREETAVFEQKALHEEYQQQLAQLNQSLSERFSEIATLTQLLEKREEIAVFEQKILHEKYQQQLAQLNQSLSERFSEIAILTQQVKEHEDALVSERQKAADEYKLQQQNWHSEQASLTKNQSALQQKLEALQQQTAQQQNASENTITALNAQNRLLQQSINERFTELATLTRHIEILSRESEQKDLQLQKSNDRVKKLKQSASWKMTSPMRALGRTFKPGVEKSPRSEEYIANSGLFNEQWYQHQYPEVADSGLSPIEHFIKIGAAKGYSTSEQFNTRWYLQTYADVAQGSINPLLHYILHGKAEQRQCLPEEMREK